MRCLVWSQSTRVADGRTDGQNYDSGDRASVAARAVKRDRAGGSAVRHPLNPPVVSHYVIIIIHTFAQKPRPERNCTKSGIRSSRGYIFWDLFWGFGSEGVKVCSSPSLPQRRCYRTAANLCSAFRLGQNFLKLNWSARSAGGGY